MANIRVDPSILRRAAVELEAIAVRMRQVGREAMQVALDAPSYDGQFGPKVRTMGSEAEARLRAHADRLSVLSEDLHERAGAFEWAEEESRVAFQRLADSLGDWMLRTAQLMASLGLLEGVPSGMDARYLQLWRAAIDGLRSPISMQGESPPDIPAPPGWTPPPPDFTPPHYDIPPHLEMPGRNELVSRDQLLFWAWVHGLYLKGRPDIDDYFNPFFRQNPVTGEVRVVPSQTYMDAVRKLYNREGDLDELVRRYRDNPLNDWEVDPITTLTGEERQEVAMAMIGWEGQTTIMLFLIEMESSTGRNWNYEPAWVYSAMRHNPQRLLMAQWQFLHIYAMDPDNWNLMEQADLVGDG